MPDSFPRKADDKVISGTFSAPLLEMRGVGLGSDGRRIIGGIDLKLAEGQRTVIMGANGSGKTMLLRLIHGLESPDEGNVLWRGQQLERFARDRQALVFQKPVMLRRTVIANIEFALSARGITGREKKRRALDALEMAHLSHLGLKPARLLSGGEQQRVAVARAIACAPEILLLDEPSASLDPASTALIEELIGQAHRRGVTIILVTHDIGQARRIADRVVFLHAGSVAEDGPASQVLEAPRSDAVKAWISGRLYFDPPQKNDT
ncbi:MAG: phosphate ABC transporter ATP-binding protein [Paracoccaceae bacterium]|nr:phosphate ABC transporter ATP-binding protein [Paracoccaceae bacterium]